MSGIWSKLEFCIQKARSQQIHRNSGIKRALGALIVEYEKVASIYLLYDDHSALLHHIICEFKENLENRQYIHHYGVVSSRLSQIETCVRRIHVLKRTQTINGGMENIRSEMESLKKRENQFWEQNEKLRKDMAKLLSRQAELEGEKYPPPLLIFKPTRSYVSLERPCTYGNS